MMDSNIADVLRRAPMKYLDQGKESWVYRLGDDKVAQFGKVKPSHSMHWPIDPTREQLSKRYAIAMILFDNNISAPRPYGIFDLKPAENPFIEIWKNGEYPALVMEYVAGIIPFDCLLSRKEETKIRELHRAELRKVSALGIKISDSFDWNIIWNRDHEKVTLIDFGDWELPPHLIERYSEKRQEL